MGIPIVTDRLIQQTLLQVLQPLLDPIFSEHSYGFRPGCRAQDVVLAAQAFAQSGRRVVVDVDLEKFFDRVDHDTLIGRLRKRIQSGSQSDSGVQVSNQETDETQRRPKSDGSHTTASPLSSGGGRAYFSLSQTPGVWQKLEEWLRHKLRSLQLKHWRRGTTIFRKLRAMGARHSIAHKIALNSRRWWRNRDKLLNHVLDLAWFDR